MNAFWIEPDSPGSGECRGFIVFLADPMTGISTGLGNCLKHRGFRLRCHAP
jgi:hypothetical protein